MRPFGRKRSASAKSHSGSKIYADEWHDRHQIVASKANSGAHKTMRAYFDALPVVRMKVSSFTEVMCFPREFDNPGPADYEERVRKRCLQSPQFLSSRRSAFPAWAWPKQKLEKDEAKRQALALMLTRGHTPTPARSLQPNSPAVQQTATQSSSSSSPAPVQKIAPTVPLQVDAEHHAEPQRSISGASAEEHVVMRSEKNRHKGNEKTISMQKKYAFIRSVTRSELADTAGNAAYQHLIDWAESKSMNLVSLWRILDQDGSMTLYKREFSQGLRDLDYGGHLDHLWEALDRDTTGLISFMEFDPEHALDLARFKGWAVKEFGSMRQLLRAMDSDRNGKVSYDEFKSFCDDRGLPDKLKPSVRTLFLLIDDPSDLETRDTLTEDEVDFVDAWQPPPYLWELPDFAARRRLQDALLTRHNENPLLAWRKGLDLDMSMKVSYEEFVLACSRLAKEGLAEAEPPGGVAPLYCAFDCDHSGWFTLRDWDETCFDQLASFTRFLKAEFKKVVQYMLKYEEFRDSGVTCADFRQSVKSLDLDFDSVEDLFEGLSMKIIRKDTKGHRLPGRMHYKDVKFLDNWRPDEEVQEDAAWLAMFTRKKT